MSNRLRSIMVILSAVIALLISAEALAQHKGINFQAVLKKPDGTYPTASGLTVTLQILDPATNCVLREEEHAGVNVSDGYMNLVIGAASATTPPGRNPSPVLSIPQAMNNATARTGLNCVDGSNNIVQTNQTYTPADTHARKLRLRTNILGDEVVADFNMRAVAFAVNSETLGGKTPAEYVQVNGSAQVTQSKLEEFFTNITAATGNAIKWNGTNLVAYDPADGANLSSNTVAGTSIVSLPWSKLTSVPTPISEIGGLSCVDGKILKKVSGSWACADESGVGSETDPTVQAYSKNAPGAGLTVNGSNQIVPDFGTTAGKVVEGNDARLSDGRAPTGSAGGDLGGTYPNPTVNQLRGQPVSATTPTADQVLVYTGGTWTPTTFGISSLRTSIGGNQFSAGSCGAHQTLNWSAITDAFSCVNVNNLNADKITAGTLNIARIPTGTTASTAAIGNDARFPSSTCGAGNKMRWDGSAWLCEADANGGGTISSLTGDVTGSGSGAVSTTVAQVGGVTAANVATGANLANAATDANTANAIVKRDGSGNFSAGTITANLTGNVTGNVSGTAANVTGTVAVANGGTGLTSAPTNGQILIGNGTGYTLATLTAGSGVTITNNAGSITIAAASGSSGLRSCNTGNANDVMVAVGAWCVDKYEASVWSAADGTGTGYFTDSTTSADTQANMPTGAANYPASCNRDGSGCAEYAVSKPGVIPSRGMTWYQAARFCANSGKVMIPDSVWQMAAIGTKDPGAGSGTGGSAGGSATDAAAAQCNINTNNATWTTWLKTNNGARPTNRAGATAGGTNACSSDFGVEDMVGNLWEWTDMNGIEAGTDTSGFSQGESNASGGPFATADGTWNLNGSAYGCDGAGTSLGTCGWKNNTPAAALRGGAWHNGAYAGVTALVLYHSGSYSHWSIGFRCARPR